MADGEQFGVAGSGQRNGFDGVIGCLRVEKGWGDPLVDAGLLDDRIGQNFVGDSADNIPRQLLIISRTEQAVMLPGCCIIERNADQMRRFDQILGRRIGDAGQQHDVDFVTAIGTFDADLLVARQGGFGDGIGEQVVGDGLCLFVGDVAAQIVETAGEDRFDRVDAQLAGDGHVVVVGGGVARGDDDAENGQFCGHKVAPVVT